jgi:hypothetical protein
VDEIVGISAAPLGRDDLGRRRRSTVVAAFARVCLIICVAGVAGCAARHGGPVVDTGQKPAGVGGTIAGLVRTSGNAASLAGRKVTAINEATGARFDISTASNGGYTIQVPAGTYRLEIELHAGEALESRPEPTHVNVGDIDEGKNFVITAAR